jgi:hypothetical protein
MLDNINKEMCTVCVVFVVFCSTPVYIFMVYFNIILATTLAAYSNIFPSGFLTKFVHAFFHPFVLRVFHIPFSLILLPRYLVTITNYEALHYAVIVMTF